MPAAGGPIVIRPVRLGDEEFLWAMLFLAAHADEQPGATVHSIRADPDLQRYLDGWGRRGDAGVVAVTGEAGAGDSLADGDSVSPGVDRAGAAWLRLFTPGEADLVTFVAPEVPELAIAVVSGQEGGGIGSALLARLLADADAAGVPAVVLSARADNPAVRLYQRHGFAVTDRVVNRVGTVSVKMVRPAGA